MRAGKVSTAMHLKDRYARSALKRFRLLMASALIAIGIVSASPANATTQSVPPIPTASQLNAIRGYLKKFFVPAAQQDVLIAKLQHGVDWDVLKGGAPVSQDSKVIGTMNYTISRWSDGSFAAYGLEQATPSSSSGISPQTVSGCTSKTGTGYVSYTGCRVDGSFFLCAIGAKGVGYTLNQGGADSITNWGIGFQSCYPPYSASSAVRVASRQTESGSNPAYARYQSDITTTTGGSFTNYVQLNVGGNKAWETHD